MLREEKGTVALELALVVPVLMVLVLGVLQFGLVYHAQHVTRSAAQEGARHAAADGSNAVGGRARALEVLSAGLGKMAEHPSVDVKADSDFVRVRVEATIRGLLPIPGLSLFHLAADASVYTERFRPAGG